MVEPAADAFRYVFSSRFRAAKHEQWRHERTAYVVWDVFWGILALVAAIGVLVLVGFVAWPYVSSSL